MGDIIQGPDLRLDSVLEVQLLGFDFHLAATWNTAQSLSAAERGPGRPASGGEDAPLFRMWRGHSQSERA